MPNSGHSCGMLIRRPPVTMARMPSMRAHGLNPRTPAVPAKDAATPAGKPLRDREKPSAPAAADAQTPTEKAALAGGFHESSYELQSG